jgi:hypothetical protein
MNEHDSLSRNIVIKRVLTLQFNNNFHSNFSAETNVAQHKMKKHT